MLLKIFLPSSIAWIIVVKLSSVKIISLAPLETSVPVIPIATPISANLSDGASFTPSPVIDTIFPCSLNAFTILTLCSGETLANTLYLFTSLANLSSGISSISAPVKLWLISVAIPSSFAIATAVFLWSPVIIIGVIPAFLASTIESFTSVLGGSIIPTIPTTTRSFSISSGKIWLSTSLNATPSTLKASSDISSATFNILFFASSVNGKIFPFTRILFALVRILSIAPFVWTLYFPPSSLSVDISFLSESNGFSETLLYLAFNAFFSKSNLFPKTIRATSVGSPISCPFSTDASEQSTNERINSVSSIFAFCPSWLEISLKLSKV